MNDRHAVFVTCETKSGHLAFRVGQPTDWDAAVRRWDRLDRLRTRRGLSVRHDGRQYAVKAVEVRAVDSHGRGIGAERHSYAFPVPYRAARIAA